VKPASTFGRAGGAGWISNGGQFPCPVTAGLGSDALRVTDAGVPNRQTLCSGIA